MNLIDTSIWIDHLRNGNEWLVRELELGGVLVHPMVIGELSMGQIRDRREVLDLLAQLPAAFVATHDEVAIAIDRHELHGSGLQLVDAHLLASVMITPGAQLATADRRLAATALRLGVAASVPGSIGQ